MTIELIKEARIGKRTHPAGTVVTVIDEVGMELVMMGKAWCRDTTHIAAVNYVKPIKPKTTKK